MAARGLFSPVAVLVSMTLVAGSNANLYFTQFEDTACTGTGTIGDIESGSAPRDGVMTEFKFKSTPTALTDCSGELKCIKRGGSACNMKDYSMKAICGTDNSNVVIQLYQSSKDCAAGNEYWSYTTTELANVRAGSCTQVSYAAAGEDTMRSLILTGFDDSVLCGLCGGTCTTTGAPAATGSGSSDATAAVTTGAPATDGTTAGANDASSSGLPHSLVAAPLAIFVGAALL